MMGDALMREDGRSGWCAECVLEGVRGGWLDCLIRRNGRVEVGKPKGDLERLFLTTAFTAGCVMQVCLSSVCGVRMLSWAAKSPVHLAMQSLATTLQLLAQPKCPFIHPDRWRSSTNHSSEGLRASNHRFTVELCEIQEIQRFQDLLLGSVQIILWHIQANRGIAPV